MKIPRVPVGTPRLMRVREDPGTTGALMVRIIACGWPLKRPAIRAFFSHAATGGRGSAGVFHPQLLQDARDGFEKISHIAFLDPPDVADAEAVGLADLAGVDHQALLA